MAYSYFRTITIDHTKVPNTDQTDFPVLVSGTYTYLKTVGNGGKVTNANGYDIVFSTDNAGTSLLPFEIETYDATTGVVNFWVKLSSVSHTVDTVFYMVYTNASVTTFQGNVAGTWNSNFLGVYHFADGNSLSVNDSTSNAFNGTTHNTPTATAGQVDGAMNLNGSNQWVGTSLAWASAPQTVSVWVNITSFASNPLITRWINSADGYWLINPSGHSQSCPNNACVGAGTESSNSLSTNTWTHLANVMGAVGVNQRLYKDGVEMSYLSHATGFVSANSNFAMGSDFGNSLFFPGKMDELKVSQVALSGDWIATEYNNQFSPSTFYTVGAETPVGGGGGVSGSQLGRIINLAVRIH